MIGVPEHMARKIPQQKNKMFKDQPHLLPISFENRSYRTRWKRAWERRMSRASDIFLLWLEAHTLIAKESKKKVSEEPPLDWSKKIFLIH